MQINQIVALRSEVLHKGLGPPTCAIEARALMSAVRSGFWGLRRGSEQPACCTCVRECSGSQSQR